MAEAGVDAVAHMTSLLICSYVCDKVEYFGRKVEVIKAGQDESKKYGVVRSYRRSYIIW